MTHPTKKCRDCGESIQLFLGELCMDCKERINREDREQSRRAELMAIFLPQMPLVCCESARGREIGGLHCDPEQVARWALNNINACIDAVIESERKP